jgi:predicted aminopeptidase
MKNLARALPSILLIAVLMVLSSCQSLYLIEQGYKNFGVMGGAVEIETPATGAIRVEGFELSPEQQRKIALVNEIRQFAASELGLEVGDAYTTFYEVPEEAISHVVIAAHPLALIPYQWRFPIVGRVTYKGFFDLADAEDERARLREEGWDTHLGPVSAFSSLGWFDDPVLSTMLDYSDGDLADVIIHELTHRTVYFKNTTDVNESMATVIGQRGARLFLIQKFGEDSTELRELDDQTRWRAMRNEILRRLRFDLDALYRSTIDREQKLARKQEIFAHASRLLYPGAEQPADALAPSNAFVVGRKQYSDHRDLFEQVLEIFGGDPARMMAFLKSLSESEDPLPELRKLASNKTPAVSTTTASRSAPTRRLAVLPGATVPGHGADTTALDGCKNVQATIPAKI